MITNYFSKIIERVKYSEVAYELGFEHPQSRSVPAHDSPAGSTLRRRPSHGVGIHFVYRGSTNVCEAQHA